MRDTTTGFFGWWLRGCWLTDGVIGPLEEEVEGGFETLEIYVLVSIAISWADVTTLGFGDGSREFERDERVAEAVEVVDV